MSTDKQIRLNVPADVMRMISVLASFDNKSLKEWCNTDLRDWVQDAYAQRVSEETRKTKGK